MAAATEPNPPPFTFVLEYMGSAMVIKTVRPASYSILRLCNIAALVLQQKDSPVVHNFQPKAVLPWAGRAINVNSDEVLHKILQVCMRKDQFILHVAVMFGEQPAFGCPERNVQGPLFASPNPSIVANKPTVVHEEGKTAAELPEADTTVQRSKRKYRCRVCKADGHGKRTCKLVQPTALVGPFTKNFVVSVLICTKILVSLT